MTFFLYIFVFFVFLNTTQCRTLVLLEASLSLLRLGWVPLSVPGIGHMFLLLHLLSGPLFLEEKDFVCAFLSFLYSGKY